MRSHWSYVIVVALFQGRRSPGDTWDIYPFLYFDVQDIILEKTGRYYLDIILE